MRPLILVILLATTACAHDVHARFPAPPDAPTGTVELVFTASASDVAVAINGVLVVRDARTERVVITDVPTGYADIVIAAGAGSQQQRIWVDSERATTVPLASPGEAPVSAIRALATSLASIALYALLN